MKCVVGEQISIDNTRIFDSQMLTVIVTRHVTSANVTFFRVFVVPLISCMFFDCGSSKAVRYFRYKQGMLLCFKQARIDDYRAWLR